MQMLLPWLLHCGHAERNIEFVSVQHIDALQMRDLFGRARESNDAWLGAQSELSVDDEQTFCNLGHT